MGDTGEVYVPGVDSSRHAYPHGQAEEAGGSTSGEVGRDSPTGEGEGGEGSGY